MRKPVQSTSAYRIAMMIHLCAAGLPPMLGRPNSPRVPPIAFMFSMTVRVM
jgi:hypothetical protein